MDTLGSEKQFVIQRSNSTIQRSCVTIYLDPQKQSVIERFPLLGEFVKRGSTVYMLNFKLDSMMVSCLKTSS